jgi:hypothetical protein
MDANRPENRQCCCWGVALEATHPQRTTAPSARLSSGPLWRKYCSLFISRYGQRTQEAPRQPVRNGVCRPSLHRSLGRARRHASSLRRDRLLDGAGPAPGTWHLRLPVPRGRSRRIRPQRTRRRAHERSPDPDARSSGHHPRHGRGDSGLGFGATFSTTYEPPFAFARRASTLDFLTNGRFAWNIVTSYLTNAAQNFGLDGQLPHDNRYLIADEYLDVAYKLWEGSWDDDALVLDRERRIVSDPSKVRYIASTSASSPPSTPHGTSSS